MHSSVLAMRGTPLNIGGGWPVIFMFRIFSLHNLAVCWRQRAPRALRGDLSSSDVRKICLCYSLWPHFCFAICSPFWHGCHSVTQIRSPQSSSLFYGLLLQDSLNVPSVSWSPAYIMFLVRDAYGSVLKFTFLGRSCGASWSCGRPNERMCSPCAVDSHNHRPDIGKPHKESAVE